MTHDALEILEVLHENDKTTVYAALYKPSNEKVVVKYPRNAKAGVPDDIAYTRLLHNEFEILRVVSTSLNPQIIEQNMGKQALLRRYHEGISLDKKLKVPQVVSAKAIEEKLQMAVELVREVEVLHKHRIIHRDINPSNFIISPDGTSAHLIDYELSSKLDVKSHYLGNPERLEGTLAYLSPEQTGRMNRIVDYRSDLYSLGITLYEMFTGQVPFSPEKPMECVHAHLAKTPPHPCLLNPELPEQIAAIILKLLAKNAEDRYQSAYRLRNDIERCLVEWQRLGRITNFPIAERDIPLKLIIPERLYGRLEERQQLLETFSETAQGAKKLMLVGGYSGIGKTALIFDVHVPVTARRAYFLSGKFEQLRRNVPYLAWTNALTAFVELLLTESAEIIRRWRETILAALGEVAAVLTEFVPAFEQILGKLPPPPPLPANETQNRFNYVMRTFIKTVCTQEHPIVIFLDDFQWADAASINLLRVIMTEAELGYIMVIAAYRDNEVNPGHPFMFSVEELEKEWSALNPNARHGLVERVILKNLKREDVRSLLDDTLALPPDEASVLAALVHEKTAGNPFFVHQFIETLYDEDLIRVSTDADSPRWVVDFADVKRLNIADNVVQLLSQKIAKLSRETQRMVKFASCIGYTFTIDKLAQVVESSAEETEAVLWEAIQEELIIPENATYNFIPSLQGMESDSIRFRFAHDRVRDAAYSFLDANIKEAIHHKLALYLLSTLSNAEQANEIFDIANHLNHAESLVQDREVLVRVNRQAGMKAKLSIANATAYTYFQAALKGLGEGLWQHHYQEALDLHNQSAETAYLSAKYDEMDMHINTILAQGKTVLDKIRGYEIRTSAQFAQLKIPESVQTGLEALHLLGMDFPQKPSQMAIILELLKTKRVVGKYTMEQMFTLPQMTDPTNLAKARIMCNVLPSLFFVNPELFPIVSFRSLVHTLQHGLSPGSAYAFAGFGLTLCAITGEIAKGVEFGQLALRLVNRKDFNENQAKALLIIYYFVEHFHSSAVASRVGSKEAYQRSLETGEIDFTIFLGNGFTVFSLFSGVPLPQTLVEMQRQWQFAVQNKMYNSISFVTMYQQYVRCLIGDAPKPSEMKSDMYDADAAVQEAEQFGNKTLIFNIAFFHADLSRWMGDVETGLRYAEQANNLKQSGLGTPLSLYLIFTDAALQAMAFYKGMVKKSAAQKSIAGQLKRLKKLAVLAKDDYECRAVCVEAMLLAVKGRKNEAIEQMRRAIAVAQVSENPYTIGLVAIEAYRLFVFVQQTNDAKEALQTALRFLQGYGAKAVVAMLEAEPLYKTVRAEIAEAGSPARATDRAGTGANASRSYTTESLSQQGIDIYSLVKGTQVITGEVNIDELIKKMLVVMAENAGAERGTIVLDVRYRYYQPKNEALTPSDASGRELFPVVEMLPGSGEVRELSSVSLAEYGSLSPSILNYVLNSASNLVIDDALTDTRFSKEPYIQKHRVRSVLCSPIMVKGSIAGVLYLENNLTAGAFTPKRIEVLNILQAQAAISIENARFYAGIEELNRTLEQKVVARTSELASANANLQEKNEQLAALDKEKNELMGVLAHDLKNPIGVVRGLTELLQNNFVDARQAQDVLGQITGTADRMLDLVTNLLDVNRLEQGGVSFNLTACDIAPIVESTIWQYESSAKAKNITLHYLPEASSNVALIDEQAMMQVLDNLVSNAVKYSPYQKNVFIRLKASTDVVRVEVQDEGPGISPEDMQKLFGKFARLTAQPTGGEHSTGLGLSIVKKMVEAMNGKVWCESELEQGATFIVELPKA